MSENENIVTFKLTAFDAGILMEILHKDLGLVGWHLDGVVKRLYENIGTQLNNGGEIRVLDKAQGTQGKAATP